MVGKDILQEIVAYKRVEVERQKKAVPAAVLEGLAGAVSGAAAGMTGVAAGSAGVASFAAAAVAGAAGEAAERAAEGAAACAPSCVAAADGVASGAAVAAAEEAAACTASGAAAAVPYAVLGAGIVRRSMKAALAGSAAGIIAEFKRKSPSAGWIAQDADSAVIPPAYEAAGAAALSVLTDEYFFGGSLEDLARVRSLVGIPILRKDFIIDEYQLLQARVAGADAVLLIAAVLDVLQTCALTEKAHELGLEVLLEIHSESELEHLAAPVDMVGVNNRNLGTFVTDVQNSFRLANLLPGDCVKVSESGISSPHTLQQLREAGYQGFLIGSAFMKTPDPAAALRRLLSDAAAV